MRKTFPDLLIFHVPSGETRDIATAMKLKRMGVVPGVADFLMFTPTHSIAIELKNQGGSQSKAQKQFQKHWEACNNNYYIVYSLEEFQSIVQVHAWPWSNYQNP